MSNSGYGGNNKDSDDKLGFSTSFMDTSADPMKDFFRYSSGKWIDSNPVPSDKSSWNSFIELNEENNEKLRDILEECLKSGDESNEKVPVMLGDFYSAAMNTELLEKQRFSSVEKYMKLIDGLSSMEQLAEVLAALHKSGIFPFFSIVSQTDEKNSDVYALYINQDGLALPDRDYYLSENFKDVMERYRLHVSRIFSIFGSSEEEAAMASSLIVSLETGMAEVSRSRADLRDAEKNYNQLELGKLGGEYSNLRLGKYLEALDLPGVDYVVLGQPEFFHYLDSMIESKSLDEIKQYMRWCVLNTAAPYLFSEIQEENFDMFGRTILGRKEQEPRWKRSVRVVDQHLGEALGELYVRRHFGPEARERMALMVDDIKEVFKSRLENLDWMTEGTKKHALSKFEKFRTKIGHPEKFRDYSSIEIRKDDFFGNVCRSQEFEAMRELSRVGKPVDKNEWLMTPPTVNAYFSPPDNEIVFPAGILQPPFFDTTKDVAVNYGAIGAVISHEITHGYDDQGRRYDEKGNLRDWWTEEDEKSFTSLAKEVVDLYSSQEVLPGTNVNGELTLGENIADIGGVSIAFAALQRRLNKEPDLRVKIDGLTPEQRFFISYGQVWRENILEPFVKMLATVDPHSPNKFRATLPVYSHPAFEETFSKDGSGMDPVSRKKIVIW